MVVVVTYTPPVYSMEMVTVEKLLLCRALSSSIHNIHGYGTSNKGSNSELFH